MSRAVGRACGLPVDESSSRELVFGRLIIRETSGRMPDEPAGWKPALRPVPNIASWREYAPFGFAPNVQRRRAGILSAGCGGFPPRVSVRAPSVPQPRVASFFQLGLVLFVGR